MCVTRFLTFHAKPQFSRQMWHADVWLILPSDASSLTWDARQISRFEGHCVMKHNSWRGTHQGDFEGVLVLQDSSRKCGGPQAHGCALKPRGLQAPGLLRLHDSRGQSGNTPVARHDHEWLQTPHVRGMNFSAAKDVGGQG